MQDINIWGIVINPNSGKGKAKNEWPQIEFFLQKAGLKYKAYFTEAKKHAIQIAINLITEGYRKIIAIGGDGTLNEVVNGIFQQSICPTHEILLAMIPFGSGNDWCRMYNIPHDIEKAIEIIKLQNAHYQDIGKVTYLANGIVETRYFVNVAGTGYDSTVAKRTNQLKEKSVNGSSLLYFYCLITELLKYKSKKARIFIDNQEFIKNIFSFSIGIGVYKGGGMKLIPHAIVDDSLLSVTMIEEVSKFKVISNIKRLYSGTFITVPEVFTTHAQKITFEADDSFILDTDGETFGSPPFTFEIINKGLMLAK